MKMIISVLLFLLVLPSGTFASDYKDFTLDLTKPYGLYRKGLAFTHNEAKEAEAKVVIPKFIKAWKVFAKKYATDKPDAFAAIDGFSEKISRPIEIGQRALVLLESGQMDLAHVELELIRYIFWEMRVKAQIVSIEDKLNDFHEAMEVVFDDIEESQRRGKLVQGCSRRDLWLLIKWEEVGQSSEGSGTDKRSFEKVIAEGKKSIKGLIKARERGDIEDAVKLCNTIKNSFKKLFFVRR